MNPPRPLQCLKFHLVSLIWNLWDFWSAFGPTQLIEIELVSTSRYFCYLEACSVMAFALLGTMHNVWKKHTEINRQKNSHTITEKLHKFSKLSTPSPKSRNKALKTPEPPCIPLQLYPTKGNYYSDFYMHRFGTISI